MEADIIFRNKVKYNKKTKFFNNIIKSKTLIHFILFLFGIVLIIFFIFNNINNRKLLKQILKNVNSNINDTILFNIKDKNKDIKNRFNLLKKLTNNNPYIYNHMKDCLINEQDKLFCFYHLIYPKKVIGKNKILLGKKSDGCYVCLDDFENIKIAYSFGISYKIQFDNELAKRGIDVYMYDHTINSLPYNNPKFHWLKIGICGNNERAQNLKTL